MTYYVYSTLTADNQYSTKDGSIVIYGRLGARHNRKLDTPKGTVTEVTDSQLDALKSHPTFMAQLNNGHLMIQTKELAPSKLDKVADADMQPDAASQETQATIKKKSKAKATKKD